MKGSLKNKWRFMNNLQPLKLQEKNVLGIKIYVPKNRFSRSFISIFDEKSITRTQLEILKHYGLKIDVEAIQ